jgi:hypothetical protein
MHSCAENLYCSTAAVTRSGSSSSTQSLWSGDLLHFGQELRFEGLGHLSSLFLVPPQSYHSYLVKLRFSYSVCRPKFPSKSAIVSELVYANYNI